MLTRTSLLLLSLLAITSLAAAADEDEKAIRQVINDYVDAAYQAKPDLVRASVHPRLQKVGYVRRADGAGYDELWETFEQMQEIVQTWNKDGSVDPRTAKREITILDRLDQIAAARLDASWGTDLIHLARIDGGWKIVSVIWQSPAPGTAAKQ